MNRLFLLALPLLTVACRGPAIPEELPVTLLAQGQQSQQLEQRFEWITDSDTFILHWQALHSGQAPAVDFQQDGVIAVYMGEQSTGGYAIRVERVSHRDAELLVEVALLAPGQGCLTTQAFTQPYQLTLVPQVAQRAVFTTRTVALPCH